MGGEDGEGASAMIDTPEPPPHTPPHTPPLSKDVDPDIIQTLNQAAETYRRAVDVEKGPVYSHVGGAAGKRNVVVFALPFDGVVELVGMLDAVASHAIAEMVNRQREKKG